MSDDSEKFVPIHHVPFGIEDPYTRQPWERFPREPRDGELVTVAALTEGSAPMHAVNVHVTTSDQQQFTVAAKAVEYSGDGDRWEAVLGAFPAGLTVGYRFEATGAQGESIASDLYSFVTVGWHSLTSVTSWETSPTHALIYLSDSENVVSTLSVAFSAPGTVRLRVWPAATAVETSAPDGLPCTVRQDEHNLIVEGGGVAIRVGLKSGAVSMETFDGTDPELPTSSGSEPLLAWLGTQSDRSTAVRLRLTLLENEALYGSGERFDQFDRRGLRFDSRVYEQYKNQGSRTYLPVPLILSSRGYALSIQGTRSLQVDAGATDANLLNVDAEVGRDESPCLEATLYLATTPLAALTTYLHDAGLPVMPPDWAFGLWMSANDWNSQERVLAEVERAEQENIPGGVVVIEAWSDETTFYIWNDAEYETLSSDRPRLEDFQFPAGGRWPDPKHMIDVLHAKGIRLLLWQIPLMKHAEELHSQQQMDADTLIGNGWCARNSDGTPYRNPGWWFPKALLPDLTDPAAVDWWLSRRRYLVEDLGVDGFKTDGGEHVWGRDVQFADGRKGDELINAFPVLYAAAFHRLLAECGREDGMTFSRAGYAGSQLYPAHWAGDENSTWDAFRHSIIAGLSAGASGIPFWGWDIAGFSEDIPSGELYRRAWMMATFCPIMQYHSEHNAQRQPTRDRTPWNIAERTGDEDVLPVCRFYTEVRRRLQPYILQEAQYTSATGQPLMCALPLAFPTDPTCRAYPYQYLFGRDLLVAPTVEEGSTSQRVYLPQGEWHDLWSGESRHGAQEVTVDVPPGHIPVYVRPGVMPPFGRPESTR